jgi:hypothetical protein
MAATLVGMAAALEVPAIASPAAKVRKKSILRMYISPFVPVTNGAPVEFHVPSEAST